MTTRWPYSNLATLSAQTNGETVRYLLATAGPTLLVCSLDGKQFVAAWTAAQISSEQEPPTKKQKVENSQSTGVNIILLATAEEHDHFVVVTDDKCIHVLTLCELGHVTELSRRSMPKRPCAVQIMPEQSLLLCADKFGDVYSLPLIPDAEKDALYAKVEPEQQPTFKPSATELTVHTQRNRKALEDQQRQKNLTKRKGPLAFEHKLLLGHVSMLTDLTIARGPSGTGRVITADRDEHIRVSRLPPQTHVIEGFCLGHTEFVSKICPMKESTLLVSGGGDDWLGVWDWTTCQLKGKINLKQALLDASVDLDDKLKRITVSRMVPTAGKGILVLCERVGALVLVHPKYDPENGMEETIKVLKTKEIPIAVADIEGSIVVSFDVRQSCHTRLQKYNIDTLEEYHEENDAVQLLNSQATDRHDDKEVDEVLYYIGKFRKRRGWEEQQPDDGEQDGLDDD